MNRHCEPMLQQRRRGNLDSGAILPRTVCVWLTGEDKSGCAPAWSCPEPAVCVCVSPSLRRQEPYSVPLLGNKWREPMLWIDAMKRSCGSIIWADAVGRVQPPKRGTLDSGAILPRAVCVWFIGADKCDARPAPPPAPNRLCVSVCPLL